MRIIDSARRRGVEDEDMLHVLGHARTYLRRDPDVVIVIGSARSGTPLEVGVVDIEGDDPVVIHAMRLRPAWLQYLGGVVTVARTDTELAELATELEDWADRVDPDTVEVESTEDLRAIADAADAARAAHAALVEAVAIARGRGRSWNRIAVPLGVSRQAARERFSRITEGSSPLD